MKKFLLGFMVLVSIASFGSTNSKCVIEDYDGSLSKRVRKILNNKGYSISDSQSESNLNIYLRPSCGQGNGPYSNCSVVIAGVIDGQKVSSSYWWVERDLNPFQLAYRAFLNSVVKSHIKNLGNCDDLIGQSNQ